MSRLLAWRPAERKDRAALQRFTCTVPAQRGPQNWMWHPKPWELRVQSGIRALRPPLFTIEPGGTPCQVSEVSQGYSANFGGSVRPISATSCRRTAVTARGVLLSCAGQAVLIPATVSAR